LFHWHGSSCSWPWTALWHVTALPAPPASRGLTVLFNIWVFTAVEQVFCDVTLCRWANSTQLFETPCCLLLESQKILILGLPDPEDGGSTNLRKVGTTGQTTD
jgi:hypothetical protein